MARPFTPQSQSAGLLLQQGMALHQQGRLAEAAAAYQQAIVADPASAAAYPLLGVAQQAQGKLGAAIASFREAVKRRPGDPKLLLQLSAMLIEHGRPAEAAGIAAEAVVASPSNLDARFALARAHFAAGEGGKGLEANRAALGVAHETFPRLDGLAAATRHALELDPGFAEAWRTLSMMVRRTDFDEEMAVMERLFADPASTDEQRMHLGFALGRGFDDLGRWDEAYRYFAEGNRLRRAAIRFSLAERLEEMARLRELFAALPPLPARRDDSPAPIFVVGLPRSGKTTIEQILARHPAVAGGGELEALSGLIKDFTRSHGLDGHGAGLSNIPAAEFAALGAGYLQAISSVPASGRRIIDTMPANFRYIGFLRLALPGARIVHCVREPLEHSVALFQKFFASAAYDYSYDLGEIAAYRRAYVGMMGQWHAQFTGFVHDIDIASVARDPEPEIRALIEFCGLPWEPACLDFRNIEQRLNESPRLDGAPSPAGRLAPYSAILAPFL